MTWIRLQGRPYNTDQIATYYSSEETVNWKVTGPQLMRSLVICLNGTAHTISDPTGELFRKLDEACSPVDVG